MRAPDLRFDPVVTSTDQDLPGLLRDARARRRISQWDLSLELGVSQRHLSFVELGRARPGRDLLLRWLRALDVPLVLRNHALQLGGHAPAFDESGLDDSAHADARSALAGLLENHEPWPALVIDARWDVVAANAGTAWLLEVVGADVELPGREGTGAAPTVNLLDLALGPLGAAVVNLPEVAAALLDQLRDEALTEPALRERVDLLASVATSPASGPVRYPPTLVTRYATRVGELSFLSMFTTFGTPHSVTLASLRAELLFPADDATRSALEQR